jgi:putative ABC transport system ATP-binding protein
MTILNPADLAPRPASPPPGEMPVVLRLHDVSKVFGTGAAAVTAVDGVDLEVRAGELVLIMGPSGSGKTTLLTVAGGLLSPTQGTVSVAGHELTALGHQDVARVRREVVGFIFQSFNLLANLTAWENVGLPAQLAGTPAKAVKARAHALLARFGLTARASFRPDQLSGGEKQRVSVARALVNDPPLILADEPTANLDARRGHEVMRLLRDIAHAEGRAVVIVSHDARIRAFADRVLWLEDGRFRELERLERDPVCGMAVERGQAVTTEQDGRTVYFCSAGCRSQYLTPPAPVPTDVALPGARA